MRDNVKIILLVVVVFSIFAGINCLVTKYGGQRQPLSALLGND